MLLDDSGQTAAGLRIRCDTRRVVVRGAGDQAWTENPKDSTQLVHDPPLSSLCSAAHRSLWRARGQLTIAIEIDHVVEELAMSLGTILLIVLVLMLIGAIPAWPHSQHWGYMPSGGLGIVVVVVLVLLLTGRI
jgi:hypothetical protein